jgi:hypothetical protein
MMANEPAQRYPTMAGVLEALHPWTATPIPPPPEEEMPQLCPAARGAAVTMEYLTPLVSASPFSVRLVPDSAEIGEEDVELVPDSLDSWTDPELETALPKVEDGVAEAPAAVEETLAEGDLLADVADPMAVTTEPVLSDADAAYLAEVGAPPPPSTQELGSELEVDSDWNLNIRTETELQADVKPGGKSPFSIATLAEESMAPVATATATTTQPLPPPLPAARRSRSLAISRRGLIMAAVVVAGVGLVVAVSLMTAHWFGGGTHEEDEGRPLAAVLEDLKSPNAETRLNAVEELAHYKDDAATVVPVLVALLKDKNREVRIQAVRSLGELGAEAKSALTDLGKLLKERDEELHEAVENALQQIQGL